jgi:ATP-dependent helicase/nuclease subunit A
MSVRLSPEQQRALDRTRPIRLAAGAGSGKTGVLIERYLGALEDVGFDLDAVLAVTFTRKATAEVLVRVREEVTRRVREDRPRAAAWKRVRERLSSAWILTIDAFCHRLLAEMEPAAGLGSRRILTGGALAEVMNEALRQVVDHVADAPDDPDREDLRRLLGALGRRELAARLSVLAERRARSVPWAREILRGAAADPAAVAAAVGRLRGRQPAPGDAAAREEHGLQTALARLFERLLARYRELLAAARASDFRQLLEDVAAAFEDEATRRRWAARFRHVLVDEFQDTDPLQWEVLGKLFGPARIERPGLFVVGDEKQAIFSFREGDVVTFHTAGAEIAAAGGAALSLEENYRSTPRLVGFFNRVSEGLFGAGSEEFEARHAPMTAARERRPETLAGLDSRIEVLIGRGDHGPAARESELHALAARVRRFANDGTLVFDKRTQEVRPATWDDQAILLRSRNVLPALEAVLLEHGVPFRVLGGVGFYDRHEVLSLCNLMRFLVDDQDDLAVLGVLRSMLFALPDSVLLAAVRSPSAAEARALWPKVQRLAAAVRSGAESLPTPSDAPVLEDAVARLRRYRRLADRIPAHDLLALAVRESDVRLTLDVLDPSGRSGANVDKLLDLARRCGDEGFASLAELERTIAAARGRETDTPEAQADPVDPGRQAVSILTVHASKGLEFPIVLVPGTESPLPSGGGRGEAAPPVLLRGDPGLSFLHEVRADEDDCDEALHEVLKDLTRREQLAELRRLLYVAATRARDHLVFSGAVVTGKPAADKKESWLKWVLAAADPSIPVLDPAPGAAPPVRREHPVLARRSPLGATVAPKIPKAPPAPAFVQGLLPFEDAGGTPMAPTARAAEPSVRAARVDARPRVVVPATALARLRACPRRFYLEHALGIAGEWADASGVESAVGRGVAAQIRGSIVHGALEGLALGLDPVARVAGVAAGFGVTGAGEIAALEDHVRQAIAKFRAWPQGKAILAAAPGSVRAEVPIEVRDPATGCSVVGSIDLLHELPGGGAVIVDFKTDGVRGDPRELAAAHGYLDQLQAYAAAAHAARGGPVSAWLFFTESGAAVPVAGEAGVRSAEACASHLGETLAALPDLAAAGFPLTTDRGTCSACPHRGRTCPGVR